MSLFVDASAFVAIIAGEPEREAFSRTLREEPRPLWSAMACWEAISALRTSHHWLLADARSEIEELVARLPFRLVAIGEAERAIALDAYQTYGRGSGHPARLNMGDCFAYACAKTSGAKLLYKGDDFKRTDLA